MDPKRWTGPTLSPAFFFVTPFLYFEETSEAAPAAAVWVSVVAVEPAAFAVEAEAFDSLAPPLQASSKALIIKVEIVIIFISTGVVPTNLMCPTGTYENRTANVSIIFV
jgi:hypothetical protein